MTPSWDLIRSFQVVATTGSLSAASRALGLTQPTVGRHIDLLEAQLHVPLFLRSRDGMQLTDKGIELVEAAQDMRACADGFVRKATGLEQELTGTVRISANEVFGVLILPRLLPGILEANPNIQIELVVSNSATNLLRRDADIAIRMFRPTQNDLIARKLADLPLGLYAHDDYLAQHSAPRQIADLKSHRMIGFDRETSLIEVARAAGLPMTPADFAFRCDNILTHVQAIRAGLGIGVTHHGLARHWPGVVRIMPDLCLPDLELWIACHSDVHLNARIRRVMDLLSKQLKTPYKTARDGP